jgi:hypothetical protein
MDLTSKTPEFNGKTDHWYKWYKTFLCRAALRGYKKIILNKEEMRQIGPRMSGRF